MEDIQPAASLLDEVNPFGTLEAVVLDDDRTVYLQLFSPAERRFVTAVWLANRIPGPETFDIEGMRQGLPPLMIKRACRHPDGSPPFDPSKLSVVWFEQGDGVVLYNGDDMIGVIPPWSGREGFMGHSAGVLEETPFAWPLSDEAKSTFEERAAKSKAYWDVRFTEGDWATLQDKGVDFLESRLGAHRRYWAIDGGKFPPMAVALFRPTAYPDIAIYSTIGMSAQPMPKVEMAYEDPGLFQRVELAIATFGEQDWAPRLLSSLAGYPWSSLSWLGEGHTMRYNSGSVAAVLMTAKPPDTVLGSILKRRSVSPPNLSGLVDRSGDPVNVLWVLPISTQEQTLAELNGTSTVVAALSKQGRGWVCRP